MGSKYFDSKAYWKRKNGQFQQFDNWVRAKLQLLWVVLVRSPRVYQDLSKKGTVVSQVLSRELKLNRGTEHNEKKE